MHYILQMHLCRYLYLCPCISLKQPLLSDSDQEFIGTDLNLIDCVLYVPTLNPKLSRARASRSLPSLFES
jgi:hypothetical protein